MLLQFMTHVTRVAPVSDTVMGTAAAATRLPVESEWITVGWHEAGCPVRWQMAEQLKFAAVFATLTSES